MTRNKQRPQTMAELIKEKKRLITKRNAHPELLESINADIDKIAAKLESKVNKDDQNLLRNFYKAAKERLDPNVFTQLEDVASTRRLQHSTSRP